MGIKRGAQASFLFLIPQAHTAFIHTNLILIRAPHKEITYHFHRHKASNIQHPPAKRLFTSYLSKLPTSTDTYTDQSRKAFAQKVPTGFTSSARVAIHQPAMAQDMPNDWRNCRYGKVVAGSVNLEGLQTEYRFEFEPENPGEGKVEIKGSVVSTAVLLHGPGFLADGAEVTLVFPGGYSNLGKIDYIRPGRMDPLPTP